jgi:signal transduction histidine kinase
MNRLKGAFIRNMSHEMRTPLTGIIGLADFLAEEVEGAHREHIRLIRSSGERLLELMDSVLDLSMLESETFRLNPERIDVAETLRAVAESIRPLAERKGLFLKVEGAAESVQATLDRSYVERILKKLIGNAVKFTEKGGIALSLSAEDGRVSITVSDTGIGIGKAFRPSLFEAFEQESSGKTRSHEGSGLGLALTKRMVEVMGGTIHLTSKKSRGSTFTVSFPTENPAAPESNTGESAAAN